MAATGYTPISLYYSTTASTAPTAGNLVNGELAINITDGKLYYKDNTGTVKVIAGTGGAGIAGGSNTQVQYNSSGSLAGSSNMTFDGTTLTVNGLATTGTVTVGDASGDALTINSSAVSIPNGLNFDSNTFVIDATNNRVGIGTASPAAPLDVNGSARFGSSVYLNGTVLGLSAVMEGVNLSYGNLAAFRTVPSDGINPYLLITSSASGITFEENGSSYGALMFKTGNSERMRIDSSGNVGIGTSSPGAKLDVNGSLRAGGLTVNSSSILAGANQLTIDYLSSATANRIVSWGANTSTRGTLIFVSASSDATLYNEYMRLDSSGNLGLGVTPSAWYTSGYKAIQVNTTAALASFGSGSNQSTRLANNWYSNTSGTDTYITSNYATVYQQGSGQHVWYTAPSGTAGNAVTFNQAMTLDANSYLGIGITSPTCPLAVTGPTSGDSAIASFGSTSTYRAQFQYLGSSTGYYGTSLILANDNGSNQGASRIASRYGGGAGSPCLVFEVSGSTQSYGADPGLLTYNEYMRLTSGGRLGVGTTTPTTKLDVAGSSSVAALRTPNILEISTVSATAATGTINYDVTTQSVVYYTTNASGNFTLNFRGSSGATLNSIMNTGDTVTVTFMCTNGSTAYYNSAVQVDGSSVTPKWLGGTAPTSGNASSVDAYTYAIIKTGNAAFTVLASQTKFA